MNANDPRRDTKPAGVGEAPREFAVVLLRDGRPVWPEDLNPKRSPRKRRRARVAVIAIVALAGSIGTWTLLEREAPGAVQEPKPGAVVAAPPITTPAAEVPPPVQVPEPEPTIEICGRGRLTREQLEATEDLLRRTIRASREGAIQAATARMLESDLPRTQAAALVIAANQARWDTEDKQPAEADRTCGGGDCSAEPPQEQAAREALRKTALRTNDPAVLQLALIACEPADWNRGSPCMKPLIQRWVELEPGNAAAWMHMASIASNSRDERALAVAMQGVTRATVVDTRFGLLAHEVTRHVDPSVDPLAALDISIAAIGIEAANVWPVQPVTKHCEPAALNDGIRRNECERIAMLFTEHSRQLLDFSVGISLGKRLGWSADRIERLEVQKEAMFQAGTKPLPDAAGELVDPLDIASCHGIERQRAWVRDLAEIGEVAALRKRIAASGMSEVQLAAQAREARRTDRDAVAAQPATFKPEPVPVASR